MCAFILAVSIFTFAGVGSTATKETNQDEPTIAKDSIQITAFTFNVYKGNYDVWSWVPRMHFRVNGPIASGSQLYVEFSTPDFHVAFWIRGEAVRFDPHLFYQGKEVGKLFLDGTEVGRPGCGAVIENNTTHYVDDSLPQKAKWARVECDFPNIKGSDTTGERDDIFTLAKNPGEYEFKLLWNNKLARSIKFTVQPGGKFDNGIATANKLGSDIVIVPVQVIGDQDGAWNRTAWKTDAFYGNPLNGFTAP